MAEMADPARGAFAVTASDATVLAGVRALYIGVTGDLARRAYEHREGLIPGFSKNYGCTKLVWWEQFQLMTVALQREKAMKHWVRDWKTNLIERDNPNWDDLYATWM